MWELPEPVSPTPSVVDNPDTMETDPRREQAIADRIFNASIPAVVSESVRLHQVTDVKIGEETSFFMTPDDPWHMPLPSELQLRLTPVPNESSQRKKKRDSSAAGLGRALQAKKLAEKVGGIVQVARINQGDAPSVTPTQTVKAIAHERRQEGRINQDVAAGNHQASAAYYGSSGQTKRKFEEVRDKATNSEARQYRVAPQVMTLAPKVLENGAPPPSPLGSSFVIQDPRVFPGELPPPDSPHRIALFPLASEVPQDGSAPSEAWLQQQKVPRSVLPFQGLSALLPGSTMEDTEMEDLSALTNASFDLPLSNHSKLSSDTSSRDTDMSDAGQAPPPRIQDLLQSGFRDLRISAPPAQQQIKTQLRDLKHKTLVSTPAFIHNTIKQNKPSSSTANTNPPSNYPTYWQPTLTPLLTTYFTHPTVLIQETPITHLLFEIYPTQTTFIPQLHGSRSINVNPSLTPSEKHSVSTHPGLDVKLIRMILPPLIPNPPFTTDGRQDLNHRDWFILLLSSASDPSVPTSPSTNKVIDDDKKQPYLVLAFPKKSLVWRTGHGTEQVNGETCLLRELMFEGHGKMPVLHAEGWECGDVACWAEYMGKQEVGMQVAVKEGEVQCWT